MESDFIILKSSLTNLLILLRYVFLIIIWNKTQWVEKGYGDWYLWGVVPLQGF